MWLEACEIFGFGGFFGCVMGGVGGGERGSAKEVRTLWVLLECVQKAQMSGDILCAWGRGVRNVE